MLACAVQKDTTPPNKILQLATNLQSSQKFSLSQVSHYTVHMICWAALNDFSFTALVADIMTSQL